MYEMSRDERRAFLLEGTRTAKVATSRKDGRPHVAPVWFLLDGDAIVFTTAETSVKRTRPSAAIPTSRCASTTSGLRSRTWSSRAPPLSTRTSGGSASRATRIGERYMERRRAAEEYGARNAVPGELLVRVTPTKVLARGGDRRLMDPLVNELELMGVALDEARAALEHDDVPVGAVVVRIDSGEVARPPAQRARADRRPDRARRGAGAPRRRRARSARWRLDGCALVVTLEPCPMCAGAARGGAARTRSRSAPPTQGRRAAAASTTSPPILASTTRSTVVDGVRADEAAALLSRLLRRPAP